MDPALWEALRAEAGTDGDRVLEAVIRLARPGIEIPDVRMVARFGTVATCRIRARDVIAVRARDDVLSLKAPRGISPGFEPADAEPSFEGPDDGDPASLDPGPADVRRGPGLGLTGAGVVVAAVDWGVDVDWAGFRWPPGQGEPGPGQRRRGPGQSGPQQPGPGHRPGGTRLLALWDQRDQAAGPRAEPYGYGAVHHRAEIDRALADPRPYERLGYHPAIADRQRLGSHGTRTLDIAAGNGQAGGLAGVAPDADLLFVHLADRDSGGLANFGDSVRLLEAVDFISRTAGAQPCAINISAGRLCGPRDGSTLVERGFDELLTSTRGRFIADSAGNYYRWRAHARGTLEPGQEQALSVVIDPTDITLNEVEVWYDGADEFAVRIEPPGYAASAPVRLGERSDLVVGGRVAGRVYNRRHDPNNGDNHIVVYLDPIGLAGPWTVTLTAVRVGGSGRFHAWIERDDSCPGCQARFTPDDASVTTTIGSIASSHLPLVVGAYDGHDPDRPVAPFSSAGPSRDDRRKPDLVAPGVRVLAARSAPAGASRNPGLLVRGNGTSFAAPHVTGAAALCFEAAGLGLSAGRLRALILDSCDPAPDADPDCRYGRGYLNIPRLAADVRRALAAPASTPATKEAAMATEDTTVLLEAGAATAYREYLYRPGGPLARTIGEHFELVAGPGQRLSRAPQPGDVLLEVTLGRAGHGRCVPLDGADLMLVAGQPRLAMGQLLLRPRPRAELTGPWPAEPALGAANPGLTFALGEGPPGGESLGEGSGDAGSVTPVRVAPGQLVVDHVAQLRSHAGTPPDMVLTWNAVELPGPMDVVVHLHGFSSRGRWMRLPADMVPVSGLDFADPEHPSVVGRTSPALLVLPRGNYFGGRSGRGYDFPALHPPGALQALVDDAVARFSAQAGGQPAVGRIILTAHSGGGASLMRILRYANPSEVHTFDALYTDPTPLTGWAQHRMAQGNGALRVLFRPGEGTALGSLSVAAALHRAAMSAGVEPGPRWRVESTRVPHMEIPRRFGWRLLADPAADLPGVDPAAGAPESEAAEDTGSGADWGLYARLPQVWGSEGDQS